MAAVAAGCYRRRPQAGPCREWTNSMKYPELIGGRVLFSEYEIQDFGHKNHGWEIAGDEPGIGQPVDEAPEAMPYTVLNTCENAFKRPGSRPGLRKNSKV